MKDETTYMAIDYGIKRVGFAMSDAGTNFAFPLCTLDRSVKVIFYEKMKELVEKHKPHAFVLGLPFHEDGSSCITTSQVRNFAASLTRRFPMPIYYMEELLSSYEAETNLRALGLKSKKIKSIIDQQAAVLILESFLNSGKKTLACTNLKNVSSV